MISRDNSRRYSAIYLTLTLIFSSLCILSVACVPQVPESRPSVTQTPESQQLESPTLPTPQPVKWLADGVITDGEYINAKSFGDFEIRWASDDEYVYIAMKARTAGWISLGIQPGSMMKDADIILGFVKDGTTVVSDHFSTGTYGPHSPDTELGGTDDILEFGGQEAAGYTIIEFKRLLNTGDKYDLPFSDGINKIIWSYGLDDQSTKKHVARGYGQIDL